MHPQLSLLLEIQDLRNQRRELASTEMEEIQERHFNIDVGKVIEDLVEKIGSLEDDLEGTTRSRYARVSGSLDRVVAPVINGVCYGCFVSIPTATAGEQDPNEDVRSCESCGRFIYVVE